MPAKRSLNSPLSLADTDARRGSRVSIIIASMEMRKSAHQHGEKSAMSTATCSKHRRTASFVHSKLEASSHRMKT